MTRLLVEIPPDIRWDDIVAKHFRENAPYYAPGCRIVSADGRALLIELAGDLDGARLSLVALARKIATDLRDSAEQVLYEHDVPKSQHPDPMIRLVQDRNAIRTGPGRFVYGGQLLSLLDALDRFFRDYSLEVGSEPLMCPSSVATESLLRSGYLRAFPHHAFFAAPAAASRSRLDLIAACTSMEQLERCASNVLSVHDQILSPTVCYHCLEAFAGRDLGGESRYTAVANCHRFEIQARDSLDRLHTFRMREIVAFGGEPGIVSMLNGALDFTTSALQRWGVAYRVTTATDPFFAGAAGSKPFFQSVFALKRELRLRVDFSDSWLSVASFNHHQQSLTDAFAISLAQERPNSGCVGWGYERLAFALIAQLGGDISTWPAGVRGDLGI